MSIAAAKLQQRRRDQERVHQETESFLQNHRNARRIHEWEQRTHQQIERREVDELTDKLLKEEEHQLHERRHELQSLYQEEMSHWKNALRTSLEVTHEQRMEQMRRRAEELKAKREEERQQFVKESYQRQWREACDDLRALESRATLDRLMQDRKLMIQNKVVNQGGRDRGNTSEDEKRGGEERRNDPQPIQDDYFMRKSENDERTQRHQNSLETKRALDQQLEWTRAQTAYMAAQIQREEQEQLRHLAQLEEQAREFEKEATQKAKKEGEEMLKETIQRAREWEERRKLEKNRDLILLHHVLESERRQIQVEQSKKEEWKEMATEYVNYLREQTQREVKENEIANAIRDGEFEKIAKRNEEKLMAEKEARRRWMEEVNLSRLEQMKRKEREAEELRREMERETKETKVALQRQEEAEEKELEQAKAERIENVMANKAMIESRAREREREQQEKCLLNKQIQFAERIHQKMLEEQKGILNVHHPLNHTECTARAPQLTLSNITK